MQDTSPQLQRFYHSRLRLQKLDLPASDAELRDLWQNCQRPVPLLYFIEPMLTRQQLVLATAFCVRYWLGEDLNYLPEGQAALAVAEAWAHSQASLADADQACEAAMERMELEDQIVESTDDQSLRQAANLRSEQAYACASVAHLVNAGDPGEDLDKALLNAREDYWAYTDAEMTATLRQYLPCPELTKVKRFYFS